MSAHIIHSAVQRITRALIVFAICGCVVCVSACSSAGDPSQSPAGRRNESQRAGNDEVLLVPILLGGTAGWCVTVVTKEFGGCSRTLTTPVVSEGCGPEEYSRHLIEAYALTTSQVAAVSIEGGAPIPTRAESALPDGLRAAFIEIRSRRVLGRRRRCPRFTPFDAAGKMVPPSHTAVPPLAFALPGRISWQSPAHPPSGACMINTTPLPGVSARWGSVATRIASYPELIGGAFLTCADVDYHVFVPAGGETDFTAAVLLDAAHPGATPAPLPDMKPLSGHADIFEAPCSVGAMVARRIAGAWLVVEESGEEEASDFQQPLRLLEHLYATIRL
jgi:hypothetical protein